MQEHPFYSPKFLFKKSAEILKQNQEIEKNEIQSILFMLMENCFGLRKIDVLADGLFTPNPGEMDIFQNYLKRIFQNEPVQYVLGKADFYGLNFIVSKEVLIPRRETEELVDWIIKTEKNQPMALVDIGTGSACIAICLAKFLSQAEVYALDVSNKALTIAAQNVHLHQVKVHLLEKNLFELSDFEKKIDLIVSNPPYVWESEKKEMKKNVLEFEPAIALFVSDEDPLIYYKSLAKFAVHHLKPGGRVYFEINEKMGEEIRQLLKDYAFSEIEIKKDMQNKDRMARASIQY